MSEATQYGYCHKVYSYSDKMAIQVQESVAQSGHKTLLIEWAPMLKRPSGEAGPAMQANWGDKGGIHVARGELHAVASVLLGFRPACEFRYHGKGRNKSYSLEKVDGGIRFTIHLAGPARKIVVPMHEVFWFSIMAVNAILANAPPNTPESMIIPLLQRTQA